MEQSQENTDLFDTIEDAEASGGRFKQFFRSRKEAVVMMSVENLTVIVAVLCVVFVVVFYLGFVRGQGVTHETLKSKLRMLRSKQELVRKAYPSRPSIVPKSTEPIRAGAVSTSSKISYDLSPAVDKSSSKPYTIQVVAYRNNAQAQKEIKKLKARGYDAKGIAQGSYFLVCVGQYRNRAEAKKDLADLKREYHDGYLRKF